MEEKVKKELIRIAKKNKEDRTEEETRFIKNGIKELPTKYGKEFLEKMRTEIDQQIESLELLQVLSKAIL